MTRALVTGGCGFVGSALCSQLMETGHEVVALDDLRLGSEDSLPTGVPLTVADVRDPALERILVAHRPDVVFHLAAIHFVPACEDEPAEAISVNVEGTQRVLAASAAAGAAAVVLASSAAVYAPSPAPHRETSALGPTDVYGHTKLWAEQLASLHNARTGQPIGVARLFNVYGPGETNPHLIPTIIEQARRGPGAPPRQPRDESNLRPRTRCGRGARCTRRGGLRAGGRRLQHRWCAGIPRQGDPRGGRARDET